MKEKLSVNEFRNIKREMLTLMQKFNASNEEITKEDYERYFSLQDRLQAHDLSEIEFSEWKDISLISDDAHKLDFSSSFANIDFSLVEVDGDINFKNCKIRNLDKLYNLNPANFSYEVIDSNPSLFLSDIFSSSFKEKYYMRSLKTNDLLNLSIEEYLELSSKDIKSHIDLHDEYYYLYTIFDLKMSIDIINSPDFNSIFPSLMFCKNNYFYIENDLSFQENFLNKLKNANLNDIKDLCFSYIRKILIGSRIITIDPSILPPLFVKENEDIFLNKVTINSDVKERYYQKNLTYEDILQNITLFKNIPIENFTQDYSIIYLASSIKDGSLTKIFLKHPDVIDYLITNVEMGNFVYYLKESKKSDAEEKFTEAVKNYFVREKMPSNFVTISSFGEYFYNVPPWLSSMNFTFINKIKSINDLLNYNFLTVNLSIEEDEVIKDFNIENIKRFEKETGFFSYANNGEKMAMFREIVKYLTKNREYLQDELDFKNGTLSYIEFTNLFAKLLDFMRRDNVFSLLFNYDFLSGEFRDNHPELFLDKSAPQELKDIFYGGNINLIFLANHKEYMPYLYDKNLANSINMNIVCEPKYDFVNEYTKRYGNVKFLNLINKYGITLYNLRLKDIDKDINDEERVEKKIREAIYAKIVKDNLSYYSLIGVKDFENDYPELFADFKSLKSVPLNEQKRLEIAFTSGGLTYEDIWKYPELIEIIKDKNLFIAFGKKNGIKDKENIFLPVGYGYGQTCHSDLELLQIFGNAKFLELCQKYGRYLNDIGNMLREDLVIVDNNYIDLKKSPAAKLSFAEIVSKIENLIARECLNGNVYYDPLDAPDFLKNNHPELFLDSNAPKDLKEWFYAKNITLSFIMLSNHKEWLPYLEGKSIKTAILKNTERKREMQEYFSLFGEDVAIKLGIKRAEVVMEMLHARKIPLMKKWYDATGGRFIPDYVVMQNIPIDDASKFLTNGIYWSNLMKIKDFASNSEARDAMLKLAYSFGVFDHDQRGYKKLQDLLTGIPKKISAEEGYIIARIDYVVNAYSKRPEFFRNISSNNYYQNYEKMINYILDNEFLDLFNTLDLIDLFDAIKKEKLAIDFSKDIISQIYRKNEDGSYTLTINIQNYPKTVAALKVLLVKNGIDSILTPTRAHQLFSGFSLIYDPDFREFLLKNMDEIIKTPEYTNVISQIQKRFHEIKTVNSNRALTLELAASYVTQNKYTDVLVGNEKVAKISAIAGYSQQDFDLLQEIYKYGKQRSFSSIPRITNTLGRYNYEILRLDDPLAMAIGTLSDCCQAIGNLAEVCMEHSMVSKHGRIFVIKDKEGNIEAQSWVWRNKDVLCFDNIEIPDKAFTRATRNNLTREEFTKEIYDVYKKAAHEILESDAKTYQKLFEDGVISKEQYDGLRLGKITVGFGYNDIAEALKKNATLDKGILARTLPFTPPVELSNSLYTHDSTIQYILENEEKENDYNGETLTPYSDDYQIFSDDNFHDYSDLQILNRLELETKGNPPYIETAIDVKDKDNIDNVVSQIAHNYNLNPTTTRIIMNSNFAIIYDIVNNKLCIADLLFNFANDPELEKQVIMQIRLAIEQIKGVNEIDISFLNDKQKLVFAKSMNLDSEIDIERGISNGRRN